MPPINLLLTARTARPLVLAALVLAALVVGAARLCLAPLTSPPTPPRPQPPPQPTHHHSCPRSHNTPRHTAANGHFANDWPPQADKAAISADATESIFVRWNGGANDIWLKVPVPMFGDGTELAGNNAAATEEYTTTCTASNAASAACVMGWSKPSGTGGDFGITTTAGFDHHNGGYPMLNSACLNHCEFLLIPTST